MSLFPNHSNRAVACDEARDVKITAKYPENIRILITVLLQRSYGKSIGRSMRLLQTKHF